MEFDPAAGIRKPNSPGGLDEIGHPVIGRLQNGSGFFPGQTLAAQGFVR
jgi:hypothetical protein